MPTAAAAAARPRISPELARRGEAALAKGAAFLLAKQLPNGSWLMNPATTALNCLALSLAPTRETPAVQTAINRGLDFVAANAQPDGSIYNRELEEYPNYSTAISTSALVLINRPQDEKVIRAARQFLLGSQFQDAAHDGTAFGGIGYGKAKRPDLSNTQWALEALYLTDHLDREPHSNDPAKARQADLAWERAVQFLGQCQNLPAVNKQAWVAADPDNRGGFVYLPGESKAGKLTKAGTASEETHATDEGDTLRSYGSMTYAGLKSMIYARLGPDDPRVKAAFAWLGQRYSFAENPGMGTAGLYYYYHTAAKALAATGRETITLADGSTRHWRNDLAEALLARQKPDGSWANENARWWESLPELTTGYSLIALGITLDRAPQFLGEAPR
jgi:squalene-hopene/tetraprenyl-beta-curcumene cyclase